MNGNEQFSFYSSSHIQNFLFIPQVSSKISFLFLKSDPELQKVVVWVHIIVCAYTVSSDGKIQMCIYWGMEQTNTGKAIVSEVILSNTKGRQMFFPLSE